MYGMEDEDEDDEDEDDDEEAPEGVPINKVAMNGKVRGHLKSQARKGTGHATEHACVPYHTCYTWTDVSMP
jgi:hypothetical protein